MIKLTDEMRVLLVKAAEEDAACVVGTASTDGSPQVSPKGSLAVYDDEHLCFWERSLRSSYTVLRDNPKVAVYYRNPKRVNEVPYVGGAMRFYGTARLVDNGPERDRVWELTNATEQQRDPERKGVAVIIRVDRVEELSGKPIMLRE